MEDQASGTVEKVKWVVAFHDFSADEGSGSYGSELDLQILYKASWGQAFGLKGALYDADEFAADTDKWMVWTAFSI